MNQLFSAINPRTQPSRVSFRSTVVSAVVIVSLLLLVSLPIHAVARVPIHASTQSDQPPSFCSWGWIPDSTPTSVSYTVQDADGSVTQVRIDWGDGIQTTAPPRYWGNADCAIGTSPNYGSQTHTYTVPGTYTITITAIDNAGLTTSVTAQFSDLPNYGSGGTAAPKIK